MIYNPERHHRRSIRLKGYDYASEGVYFVTVSVLGRECILGRVDDGVMDLNEAGVIVAETWTWLEAHFPRVVLGSWVVMPNHLHGIVVLTDGPRFDEKGGSRTAPSERVARKPLGRLVGAFKTVSTMRINALRGTPGRLIWQRNFYEHVVRNEKDYGRIDGYIWNNVETSTVDQLNPDVPSRW